MSVSLCVTKYILYIRTGKSGLGPYAHGGGKKKKRKTGVIEGGREKLPVAHHLLPVAFWVMVRWLNIPAVELCLSVVSVSKLGREDDPGSEVLVLDTGGRAEYDLHRGSQGEHF